MKKFIKCIALTIVLASLVYVDVASQTPKQKSGIPVGWSTKLKLTPEQKRKISATATEYAPKITDLQQQIISMKAEQLKKQVALLTDSQKKTLRATYGVDD